jgi:hypothetical protein
MMCFCGDCLRKYLYIDYGRERSAAEIKTLMPLIAEPKPRSPLAPCAWNLGTDHRGHGPVKDLYHRPLPDGLRCKGLAGKTTGGSYGCFAI